MKRKLSTPSSAKIILSALLLMLPIVFAREAAACLTCVVINITWPDGTREKVVDCLDISDTGVYYCEVTASGRGCFGAGDCELGGGPGNFPHVDLNLPGNLTFRDSMQIVDLDTPSASGCQNINVADHAVSAKVKYTL